METSSSKPVLVASAKSFLRLLLKTGSLHRCLAHGNDVCPRKGDSSVKWVETFSFNKWGPFLNDVTLRSGIGSHFYWKDENVTSIYKIWTENFAWDPVMWRQLRKWLKWSPRKGTMWGFDILTIRKQKSRLHYSKLTFLTEIPKIFLRTENTTRGTYSMWPLITFEKFHLHMFRIQELNQVTASPTSADTWFTLIRVWWWVLWIGNS